MVVGFAADGRERNVIGIDVSCTPVQTKAQVLDIAQKTSELVGGKTIISSAARSRVERPRSPIYGVIARTSHECVSAGCQSEGRQCL
jgi:1-aminocyclopropane-1-carboxylate deaminase